MVMTPKIGATMPISSVKTSPSQTKASEKKRFNATESKQAAPTGETYQTFSVTALSGLFLDDSAPQSQRQQAVVYGNDLLDQLDKIRLRIISGTLPKEDLIVLTNLLKNRPHLDVDPELENLIREIETRAAVELAKLEV